MLYYRRRPVSQQSNASLRRLYVRNPVCSTWSAYVVQIFLRRVSCIGLGSHAFFDSVRSNFISFRTSYFWFRLPKRGSDHNLPSFTVSNFTCSDFPYEFTNKLNKCIWIVEVYPYTYVIGSIGEWWQTTRCSSKVSTWRTGNQPCTP
jgi:hypothetical protein